MMRLALALLATAPALAQCDEARLLVTTSNMARAVSLSGDLAVVGHPFGPARPRVHLHQRVAGAWLPPVEIKAPPGAEDGAFGSSLALDGGLLAVADIEDDLVAENAGAVYLIEPGGPIGWSVTARLNPPEADANTWFGRAVAVDEAARRVAVGAPRIGSWDYGAVFVFEEQGGLWREVARLTPANPLASDGFGGAIDLDGDRMVVGLLGGGSAYVFERIGGAWTESARLDDPVLDQHMSFGRDVALHGDRILVGEPDGNDGSGPANGRVHVFDRVGSSWVLGASLAPKQTNGADGFGHAVDLDGARAAVGAPDATAWGQPTAGRVEVFELKDSGWKRIAQLKASDGQAPERLGLAVALEGERVLGARSSGALAWEGASSCPGPGVGFQYCTSTVLNSAGLHGALFGLGSDAVASDQFVLQARDLPAGMPAFALASRDTDFVVMPPGSEGTLCLGGNIARLADGLTVTLATGRARFPIDLQRVPTSPAAPILPGETWRFQVWYRDMNPGPTSNFTEALEVLFH